MHIRVRTNFAIISEECHLFEGFYCACHSSDKRQTAPNVDETVKVYFNNVDVEFQSTICVRGISTTDLPSPLRSDNGIVETLSDTPTCTGGRFFFKYSRTVDISLFMSVLKNAYAIGLAAEFSTSRMWTDLRMYWLCGINTSKLPSP